MALGAATIETSGGKNASSPTFVDRLSFAGDGAYPSNGTEGFEDYVRAKLGDNRTIIGILAEDCGAYRPVYDRATDKLKVFVTADGTEVSNGTNLSATTMHVVVLSK